MTRMKKLLIGAAVTGALAMVPMACKSTNEAKADPPEPTADKQGCRGMPQQGDAATDRDGCAGHGEQNMPEKAACAGKEGCGGKAGNT